MLSEKSKWVDAIVRLIELTQQGKIDWLLAGPDMVGTDVGLSPPYVARHNDRMLRLRKLAVISDSRWDENSYQILLEMITDYGEVLYQFPDVAVSEDLLEAVQYQVAGVGDYLDELLGEGSE